MSEQHLNEVENMLFELKHAMVPQDMETTIAHGKKIDALEFVIKQTKRLEIFMVLAKTENEFRNVKALEKMVDNFEEKSERYRETLEFYADENNYESLDGIMITNYLNRVDGDRGKKAREALKESE